MARQEGAQHAGVADEGEELTPPPPLPRRRGSELQTGIYLLPEQRLAAFSPEQLEMVVLRWMHEVLTSRYARIRRYGQSGDLGRDVAGFESPTDPTPWDNFQCKRYAHKLAPSDLWSDIGKLVYWVTQRAYPAPRNYSFVSPKGVGTKASDILDDPERVRTGLIDNWERHCGGLCALEEIRDAIEQFAFPHFDTVRGDALIEDLRGTPTYSVLFGGGLSKPRPLNQEPPDAIADHELPYIECLVEAYADHCAGAIRSTADALGHDTYGEHLRDSRRDFYCAESLREFSKDVLIEPDDFNELKNLIFDGIKYKIRQSYPSGYERVLAVCAQSATVQVGDHPLRGELTPADRSGICHQLANDRLVRWKI